jgi:hypothetical protein
MNDNRRDAHEHTKKTVLIEFGKDYNDDDKLVYRRGYIAKLTKRKDKVECG